MIGFDTMYVPGGKYTRAGVTVDESQPKPHRFPDEIAKLIASVSSVEPSPDAMSAKKLERNKPPCKWAACWERCLATFCPKILDISIDLVGTTGPERDGALSFD